MRAGRNRAAVILTSLALCIAVLFSAFLVVEEIGHECSGPECHICCLILNAAETIRGIGSAILLAFGLTTLLHLTLLTIQSTLTLIFRNVSLISQKVRLND